MFGSITMFQLDCYMYLLGCAHGTDRFVVRYTVDDLCLILSNFSYLWVYYKYFRPRYCSQNPPVFK